MFVPGLHGREHLNVSRWLNLLKNGNTGILTAFEHQSFGVTWNKGQRIPEYLGAFHPDYTSDIPPLEGIIEEAGDLFEENCGYRPTHFIAPNRESAKALDSTFRKVGIKYMTMAKLRHYPLGNGKYSREFIWLGKRNKELDQIYITRNCGFEPSESPQIDCVDICLKEIKTEFQWHKPAIISSHRVNYIGFIDPSNALNGLKELDRLLSNILRIWPNVEFMTSTELGDLISSERKN